MKVPVYNRKEILRAGIVQLCPDPEKEKNLEKARALVFECVRQKAGLVALPELFAFAPKTAGIKQTAENILGRTSSFMGDLAHEHGIWLLAGSIIEKNPAGRPFNTSLLFNPGGKLVAKYRKIHLFDVEMAGKLSQRESLYFSAGKRIVTASLNGLTAGLSICFDLRYPELYRRLAQKGADILFVPSAFEHETGKAHWEILIKARAIENLSYVIAPNQTGLSPATGTLKWGHSAIVDPWGRILASLGTEEGIAVAEIDLAYLRQVRKRLPFPGV